MEFATRRPALPLLNHQRRTSVPRLSIIIKDARFPDAKHIISPISPISPRGRSKNIATVVVMSPRIFSPVSTPKILSPASSRRGSEESTASRRASRTSINMGSCRRRESIIYRNEQEYDSATTIVERKITPEDTPMDEDFPSTKSSSRRRTTRAAMAMQEQTPIIVGGQRRRSSIVVVHNCSPPPSATREFSEMPEESEDED
ncbi:hypothetical protein TWF703_005713 [Orbilia oligospora]|uniref:Uncharacterized protein n=1 Tax=Orbilia oligospora TaxID=2813651 RepID=A0A7C8JXB9_ORBOL|nr:hypothetical protein TWF703_005713 [Orbilia oligospora]